MKFVPTACIVGAVEGEKYYQYTAIDEYSRYRYLEAFKENSTYSSEQFVLHVSEQFAKKGIKVERSHRKDNEYFYATHHFYSFKDFQKQLAVHSRKYNDFFMRPFGWKSPDEFLNHFLTTGEVFLLFFVTHH